MRRSRAFLWGVTIGLACQVIAPLAHGGGKGSRTGALQVMCTTRLLSAIAEAVGGDQVEVHTVVPYGMCPGHFDLSPGEAQRLRDAELLLFHGFEQFLKGANIGRDAGAVKVHIKGNWMIPDIHTQAVQRVLDVLVRERPKIASDLAANAQRYVQKIGAAEASLRGGIEQRRGLPVICSNMNADLAEWLGCEIIAEYPRDADISVKALHETIVSGQKMKARLVIDNKQSSGKAGRTLAAELDVPIAILSNFPDSASADAAGYPYITTLSNNAAAIVEALTQGDTEP